MAVPELPRSPYPQPPANTPIAWQVRLGAADYTFVALRVAGSGWFVTGQVDHALTWDALCAWLPPVDGRFLVLGVVGQIPHPALNGAP